MEENKTKMSQRYEKYWLLVENALNDGSRYGYKAAIIETEKILKIALDEKNIPGETYDDKIDFVRKLLANPDKLKYSRAMCKKIIEELGFDISLDDTKEIIAGYYKAISDVSEMTYHNISAKDKVMLFAEKYSKKLPHAIKSILIAILVFFGALFISSETEVGRSAGLMLIEISRMIFYKFIPAIFAITAFIFASLVIIAAIKKRKKY